MRYFKLLNNKKGVLAGVSMLSLLGALFISTAASASLVVIGSKDIKLNHLTSEQLSNIYLGKGVSLATSETLNPINQNPNSKIYGAFYQQAAGMTSSSVSSYWSGLEFSGDATQPEQVNSDYNAIAAVENNSKTIAYVDSKSLGAQIANVKILYGTVPASDRNNSYNNPATQAQPNAQYQRHAASDDQMRAQLAKEIATLRVQQEKYQQMNKQREQQLLTILKAEKAAHIKNGKSTKPLAKVAKKQVKKAPTDLWSLMASHYNLSADLNNPTVKKELSWYLHNKWVVNMMVKNAAPYIGYVYQQTQKRGIPAEFALLPMVESGYVATASSPVGAVGLWQMMPNTASSTGLNVNWWYDGRRDVITSTNAALDYLARLHGGLHTWALAAASYDAGEGSVLAAIDYNKRKGLATNYWKLPLPQETRNYYPKLLALSEIIKNPAKYGFKLPTLSMKPALTAIKIKSQIDRAQIANLAGTSEAIVKKLNPGMLRWATDPQSGYTVVIPANKLSTFKINLARLSGKKRLMWAYHPVQSNETLVTIAKEYHSSAKELKKVNDLSSNQIVNGMGIVVPMFSQRTYAEFDNSNKASQIKMTQHLQQTARVAKAVPASAPVPAASTITASDILNDSPAASNSAKAGGNQKNLKSLMNKLYN